MECKKSKLKGYRCQGHKMAAVLVECRSCQIKLHAQGGKGKRAKKKKERCSQVQGVALVSSPTKDKHTKSERKEKQRPRT